MPSFDIVSQVDTHELTNAVDQTNREVGTRYDFKGADARVELAHDQITLHAENEFQLEQMLDILRMRLARRNVDVACLDIGKPQASGSRAHQSITVRQGIDKDLARDIIRRVKDSKLKVQAAVQSEQVRVTGKKRDDLQQVIALLRAAELGQPLQYINFRD